MAPRRRRLGAVSILLALLAAGCSEFDCPDVEPYTDVDAGPLRLVAPAVAEVMTLAFVEGEQTETQFVLRDGIESDPVRTTGAGIEVVYDLEGDTDQATAPPLVTAVRGDTVFVYVEGSVDPSVFQEACSIRPPSLRVDIRGFQLPVTVDRVSLAVLRPGELHASARTFLQHHDADRRARRPRTA
ncbi:MAG: hypothetical protein AAF845_01005 [Bacteroidota bacterium]